MIVVRIVILSASLY